MPALGYSIETITARVVRIMFLPYELNDNYEGVGINDQFLRDTVLVQNLSPRLIRDANGEMACELYENGKHLMSFTRNYPPNVQNTFNGETDPETIYNQFSDLLQNL